MGKRKSRNSKRAKKPEEQAKTVVQAIEQTSNILYIQTWKEELSDAFQQIFTIYLNELQDLKSKKLKGEVPGDYTQEFKLALDPEFLNVLTQKAEAVSKSDDSNELSHMITARTQEFLIAVRKEILAVPLGLLLISLACDAYTIVRNACEEVQKITVFTSKTDVPSFKQYFYTQILKSEEIAQSLEKTKRDELLHSKRYNQYRFIKDDLKRQLTIKTKTLKPKQMTSKTSVEAASTISTSSGEDSSFDKTNLQGKSLEELVSFINGEKLKEEPKTRRKRRKRKPHTDDSIEDKKVEEFKRRLESVPVRKCKLKPNLSRAWLENLRSQIKTS